MRSSGVQYFLQYIFATNSTQLYPSIYLVIRASLCSPKYNYKGKHSISIQTSWSDYGDLAPSSPCKEGTRPVRLIDRCEHIGWPFIGDAAVWRILVSNQVLLLGSSITSGQELSKSQLNAIRSVSSPLPSSFTRCQSKQDR